MVASTGEGLYRRADVLRLFTALRDGVIEEVKPEFSFDEGFTYPDAERITAIPPKEMQQVLESLAEEGVLIKELADVVIACPCCRSARLSLKLRCTSCGSSTLRKGVIVEHLPCGHLDFEQNFVGLEGMMCPKCGKPLRGLGVDYRKPGSFYRCSSCKELTASPKRTFTCGDCGVAFNEDEEALVEAYTYRVNDEKRDVIERESIDLKPVVKKLGAIKWEAKTPAPLKGRSGVEHTFALAAYAPTAGERPDLVADIVIGEKPVDEGQILSLVAKAFDVEVEWTVLVAVPSLNYSAKRLAEFYNMCAAESSTPGQAVDILSEALDAVVEKRMKDALKREVEVLEAIIDEMEKG